MTVVEFVRTFRFYRQANILSEFGHSDDNFLLSPDGKEIPCPGQSHEGVAQSILRERGVEDDNALGTLINEGWIRISGAVFELYGYTASKKARMAAFISKHPEIYDGVDVVEIDNLKKGFSKQYPMSSIMGTEFNPQASEAAGDYLALQNYDPSRKAPKGYIPDYMRNAPELVKQRFREGD
jgi:hypothetical protein